MISVYDSYLYYIINIQKKISQTRIYELLWISNDAYKLFN